MSQNLDNLLIELKSYSNPQKAKDLSWFFKTGKDGYGEGDIFAGIIVPNIRRLVKIYWDMLDFSDVKHLLHSPIHEYRLLALLILVKKYPSSPNKVNQIYLDNTDHINNWDLVDLSARDIVGRYCHETNNCSTIYSFARSKSLWEKRISIISTSYFIKQDIFAHTLDISTILLNDSHDLIHKAVGWMLREVGKRDQKVLTDYLDDNHSHMARTTLRYSIERLPDSLRIYYLKLK